jgi:magnesium-transporting ATPase (P-type)
MIGWLNGEAILSMLLTSISLAGRHSEALPALVTIALAFGAKRLAKVMHLYENFRRWKHLDQLPIFDKTADRE